MSLLYLHAGEFTKLQGDRFFIKTFLVDNSINANHWAVTAAALQDNIASFIGKPIVLTPEFGHPEAPDGDDLLKVQEKYRVGTIIDIGIENDTGKGWAIAEITEGPVKDLLMQYGISFV